MGVRSSIAALAIALALPRAALADEKGEAPYDQAAVSSALAETPGPKQEKPSEALEVPPPPPRRRGLVVETQLGVMGFVGKLANVSPTASHFEVRVGYEVLRWVMLFGEGDVAFTSTRYSPPSRGYTFYGVGAGARLSLDVGQRVAIYGQGDVGMMQTTTDVLHTYGFYDAENLNVYFGGALGLDWHQVNPHYALGLSAGARKWKGYERALASDPGIALLASAALRYAF